MSGPRRATAPSSTYRLQLTPDHGFAAVTALVPHLAALGVGAVYLSPSLEATPGSTHGYDVTDPRRAREELGGEAARRELMTAAREAGLGVVVDIVPNHMSIAVPPANPWWWDVLTYGPDSPYADHFDIDFSRGRILVPVLGDAGEIDAVGVADGELRYHEHRFPIAPGTGDGSPRQIHDRQHYELVDWRRGTSELTYRRFFDITTLAAVRVERDEVFDAVHAETLRWVADGDVTGLRVDHPDGLADPTGYAHRLRETAGDTWLVVEKILHPGERLPADWPVDGTTGYDALREITGVLVDPAGEQPLTALAAELGQETDYAAVELAARRLVTEEVLVAEVRRIAGVLMEAADGLDVDHARRAVAETMVAFGVYRSYLPIGAEHWTRAIETARVRNPGLTETLAVLDERVRAEPDGELAVRIQQTSPMVVAKGTEDTAFYRYTRFAPLTEVGGAPDVFAVGVEEFHRLATARETDSPTTMTTLTTHDTKRSEDVRARLAVLAEVGEEWAGMVRRWTERCGLSEPSLNLLAWQTIVGAAPIGDDRLAAYLDKAAKEAKLRTSWTEPDEDVAAEIAAWPGRVRRDAEVGGEVAAFAERIAPAGWSNGLTQKLAQLCGPGVPDVYQGTELWDLSLVDPDNRRGVDHAERVRLLARVADGWIPPVDATGAAKLLLVHRALRLRRDRPELFTGYRPLTADGPAAGHLLGFARHADLAVLGTRLPVGLGERGGWDATTLSLPDGRWRDALTGREHRIGGAAAVADLLAVYPVALLVREDAP